MTGGIGSTQGSHWEPQRTPNPAYDRWISTKEEHIGKLIDDYKEAHGEAPTEGQEMLWRQQYEQEHPAPPPYLLG